MNVESNRLATFSSWPSSAVVPPDRIARAGFYVISESETVPPLTVECFACHLRLSDWQYGDQMMTKHRRLSPSCPFVCDPSTSGNVPLTGPTVESQTLQSEVVRLRTFAGWPVPNIVEPERLARAGFVYLGDRDTTKCPFCKGVVRAWELGDDPDREHRRHFPNCPFVLSTIVPRLEQQQGVPSTDKDFTEFQNLNVLRSERVGLNELGVNSHRGPKRMEYATVENRLKTFSSWPSELIQTPDTLSQAGFYYEGKGDQVRCFHCDLGLRHWNPQDDPWTEHARWYPQCSFVVLVKGQEFVNACKAVSQQSQLQEVRQSPKAAGEVLEQEMRGSVVQTALSIGLSVEWVKRALLNKIITTGRGYSQPDALVEAALNFQREDEDQGDSAEGEDSGRERWSLEGSLLPLMRRYSQERAPARDIAWEYANKEHKANNDSPLNKESSSEGPASIETAQEAKEEEKRVPVKGRGEERVLTMTLEEENRVLKEQRLCKICMDIEVGIVFLPCGHLATCIHCAPNLQDCPVCRSAIKATVRTFLA